jgi:hypothetical protein
MKRLILLAFLFCTIPVWATTWYVNPNGGTRYSVNMTSGQCNGKSPAPYPGSGVNQNCAFGDIRYLWTDGSGTGNPAAGAPKWGWIGASGDTYLIDCPTDCRIGPNGPNGGQDFGLYDNASAEGAPVPLSGTPGAHTKILGINYANCTSDSAKAHINGGYSVKQVFDLRGTSYVDIACLNITDHSNCGQAAQLNGCSWNYPLTDFASNGIRTDNTATNVTLTDIRIHGMASAGILGATGGGWVVTRVVLAGNAGCGWEFDDASGTSGTGTLLLEQFQVIWSGCAEEYPIVDSLPYQDCTDDGSLSQGEGYGDGIGTGDNDVGWHITIDHSVAAYNTQDGFDLLHLRGPGSSLTISNSLAYSNMGNQMKSGRASTYYNNLIYANCGALASTIPGTPSGFNSRLSDFCRAGNEAVMISVADGQTSYFEFNTIIGSGETGGGDLGGIVCVELNATCTTSAPLVYENNITLGFSPNGNAPDRWTDGTGAIGGVFAQTGSVITNNADHGTTSLVGCHISGETNTLCLDPQLTDETWHPYGYGNMAPVSGSRVEGAGVGISGVTVDYVGNTRPNPPSIGALE